MKDTNGTEVYLIPLDDILPDENQPRKSFDAYRLGELVSSIKDHGIMQPLVVEAINEQGKFLLVDGERRYRASKELNMKKVPCVVRERMNESQRLIQQFHLQEQHEGWSPVEKAIAVGRLAKNMNLGVTELARMLSLPRRTIGDYEAFSKLVEQEQYQKNEVSLRFVRAVVSLKSTVRKQYSALLDEEFSKKDEAELEKAIYKRIKKGEIEKPVDLLKIRDAVKVNPKIIEKFIKNDEISADKIFIDSKAKVAWLHRNILNNCRVLTTYVESGLRLGVDKLFDEEGEEKRMYIEKTIEQLTRLNNKL